jgi:hypothetical protein
MRCDNRSSNENDGFKDFMILTRGDVIVLWQRGIVTRKEHTQLTERRNNMMDVMGDGKKIRNLLRYKGS